MPDLTPLEAAETLEIVYGWRKGDDVPVTRAALYAASCLRAIAAGEYKRVVHCKDCALLDRSPCPARDPETGETRNCVGYCACGALMDGKDDSHA